MAVGKANFGGSTRAKVGNVNCFKDLPIVSSGGSTYVKMVEWQVGIPGRYRVVFDTRSSDSAQQSNIQVRVNGVDQGAVQIGTSTSPQTKSVDIEIQANALVQLYGRVNLAPYSTSIYVENCYLRAEVNVGVVKTL